MLDCVKCGACCFMGYDVLLDAVEERTFAQRPHLRRLTVLYHSRLGYDLTFLKKAPDDPNRCICLQGELGNVCCEIYHERPQLCRVFEVGCPECLAARRRMGIDPPEAAPPPATEPLT